MSGDEEFEDFLKRRKPLFRAVDDELEPPAELDRIVLRQAREAIRPEEPMRVFRAPRWSAPVAIAATLVVGLAFVFKAGLPTQPQHLPEVTIENVAQREYEPPQPASAPEAPAPRQSAVAARNAGSEGTVMMELAPAWRGDPKAWMAEIDRLRASGDTVRAEAELAEFNRQHRALAVSPDR